MSDAQIDPALGAKAAALEGEIFLAGEIPPGAGAPPPGDRPKPVQPSSGELLTMLFRPTFDIVAPDWKVTDDECAMLGEAYGAVIDKYWPDFQLGVELSAVIATAVVFGPRLKRSRKPEKKPADGATDGAPSET